MRGTVLQFDHRNSSLRQWLVEDYFGGPDCLGDPNIDGLILDDDWTSKGPTEENSFAAADMGLSARDLAEIGVLKTLILGGGAGYNAPSGASSSSSLRVQNTSKGFK